MCKHNSNAVMLQQPQSYTNPDHASCCVVVCACYDSIPARHAQCFWQGDNTQNGNHDIITCQDIPCQGPHVKTPHVRTLGDVMVTAGWRGLCIWVCREDASGSGQGLWRNCPAAWRQLSRHVCAQARAARQISCRGMVLTVGWCAHHTFVLKL